MYRLTASTGNSGIRFFGKTGAAGQVLQPENSYSLVNWLDTKRAKTVRNS